MAEYARDIESAKRRLWWAAGWKCALDIQTREKQARIWPPFPWNERQEDGIQRNVEFCKRRLTAALTRQKEHGDLESNGVFRCSELLDPLVYWGDGLFGAALQNGKINHSRDIEGEWEEIRAERMGDEWTITYAPNEVQAWEVYRGAIPNRSFWRHLLRNSNCGGFRKVEVIRKREIEWTNPSLAFTESEP